MCWWKVHSKYRKCTIFLHILRLICFVREKWLKEFLRKLTVHSECYIIWWEKWQRRHVLWNHLSSAFIIKGTIYLFILPHLLTLFPVLILVVILFFIHAFRYKQIEIFDIVLVFFLIFCVHVYTDFDFWQLHVTITIVWITYTYSRYIYFYGVFMKCSGRRDSESQKYSS